MLYIRGKEKACRQRFTRRTSAFGSFIIRSVRCLTIRSCQSPDFGRLQPCLRTQRRTIRKNVIVSPVHIHARTHASSAHQCTETERLRVRESETGRMKEQGDGERGRKRKRQRQTERGSKSNAIRILKCTDSCVHRNAHVPRTQDSHTLERTRNLQCKGSQNTPFISYDKCRNRSCPSMCAHANTFQLPWQGPAQPSSSYQLKYASIFQHC